MQMRGFERGTGDRGASLEVGGVGAGGWGQGGEDG